MAGRLARVREGLGVNRALHQQLERAARLQDAGKTEEAIAEYRAILAARDRRGELEHPNALIAATNLALLLAASGQAEEAALLSESTTNRYASVAGLYGEATLISRSNLGRILHTLGRFTEAAANHEFVLSNGKRTHGADYALAIGSRWQLGYALSRLGQWDQAEGHMRGVVDELTERHGPTNTETLQARLVLGDLLNDHDKFEAALSEYTVVAEAGEPGELVTLSAHLGRAGTLTTLGRYAEAEAECEQAIAGNQPLDEMARLQRAVIRRERGDLEAAEADLQSLWDDCENEWGTDAIITWSVRAAYGELLIELERFDEAAELITDVVTKWSNVHGPISMQALCGRHWLGRVLLELGRLDEAEREFQASLGRPDRPPTHHCTLTCREGLADIAARRGDRERAAAEYTTVLNGWIAAFGEDHPATREARTKLESL